MALKNRDHESLMDLATLIGKTKQASAKLNVRVTKISGIKCLMASDSELDPDDEVGTVLDSEASIVAVVTTGEEPTVPVNTTAKQVASPFLVDFAEGRGGQEEAARGGRGAEEKGGGRAEACTLGGG